MDSRLTVLILVAIIPFLRMDLFPQDVHMQLGRWFKLRIRMSEKTSGYPPGRGSQASKK